SRLGAVLPAPEPGRRPGRPRTEGRSRAHSDARAGAPRRALRGGARLSCVRARGARGARVAALSADRAVGERGVQRNDGGGDGATGDVGRRLAARAAGKACAGRRARDRAGALSGGTDQAALAMARVDQIGAAGGADAARPVLRRALSGAEGSGAPVDVRSRSGGIVVTAKAPPAVVPVRGSTARDVFSGRNR